METYYKDSGKKLYLYDDRGKNKDNVDILSIVYENDFVMLVRIEEEWCMHERYVLIDKQTKAALNATFYSYLLGEYKSNTMDDSKKKGFFRILETIKTKAGEVRSKVSEVNFDDTKEEISKGIDEIFDKADELFEKAGEIFDEVDDLFEEAFDKDRNKEEKKEEKVD